MEYTPGEKIIYGMHGICTVREIETGPAGGKKQEYYVLEPSEHPDAIYYVPVHNAAASAKLRRMLTRDELTGLLREEQGRDSAWVSDENLRKQRYRQLIGNSDPAALLSMVHTLHRHKTAQLAAGRKLHICDESFLRDAEKLLSAEISYVMCIPLQDVEAYVRDVFQE